MLLKKSKEERRASIWFSPISWALVFSMVVNFLIEGCFLSIQLPVNNSFE